MSEGEHRPATERAGGNRVGEATPAGPAPASQLAYAEAAEELESIISELDQGLVDVDHLEVRFRRAIEIVEELDRRIHRAKEEVDALMPRLGAVGSGAPGAPVAAGGGAGAPPGSGRAADRQPAGGAVTAGGTGGTGGTDGG